MSLDFSNVKSWNIPEGEVLSASLNGVTIYTKPVEHTYEPTSQNGDGLYGLVDGQYVPLTCTITTTYSWKYNGSGISWISVPGSYKPYYKNGSNWSQYGTSLSSMSTATWNSKTWYYRVSSSDHKIIIRDSTTTYSYKDTNGNTYTGQRYIQTS